ncbi:MAG TPA: methylated-DNA--[protein]-cysteine S-methyltransferase [Syntrophomonadaceae bacterium]|nr:methylated-DNA--[protein]-cysteine S-methyltransferase [Syntrophomonadaceae bacterium]
MYYSTTYSSPVGLITLASCDNNLVGLWIENQKYHSNKMPETMTIKDNIPVFTITKQWLNRYFAGDNPDIAELQLAPIGSEFRQEVWNILCKIPYGKVVTYGDIAKEIAAKRNKETMSSQAVGGAVGHNPIAVIIPCHRVVGSNGSLTGFASGIATKIKLLELEGVDMSPFFTPKKGTAL